MRRPLLGLMLAMAITAPARADFAAGAEAYDGGDYVTAYAEWHRLAAAGDAVAQTALAGLLRAGEGRPADATGAARWYRRAAEQGEPIARLNLGEMYMLGDGVTRDRARAWLWLTLAARQGMTWAARTRDALQLRMGLDELNRARALIRSRDRR
jgi:TPR repeat protein